MKNSLQFRSKSHLVFPLLYLYFLLHVVIGLERTLYANEFFTIVGLILSPIYVQRIYGFKQYITRIQLSLTLLTLYIFLQLAGMSVRDISRNPYEVFRTLPFAYSFSCIFFGFYIFEKMEERRLKKPYIFERILGIASIFLGNKLSPTFAAIIGMRGLRHYKSIVSLILIFGAIFKTVFVYPDTKVTAALIALIFIFFSFYRNLFLKILDGLSSIKSIFFVLVIIVLSSILLKTKYQQFYSVGYEFFGNTIDVNTIWRGMFWVYSITRTVSENFLFGIGFGTPLFDANDPQVQFVIMSSPADEHLPYTLSVHNALVYIFTRLGAVGFIIFFWFLLELFRSAFKILKRTGDFDYIYIGTLSIIISALFNVVVETPLFAGIFWTSIGMMIALTYKFSTLSAIR